MQRPAESSIPTLSLSREMISGKANRPETAVRTAAPELGEQPVGEKGGL